MHGHYSPESHAVVVPFPVDRTRDAEVRKIHRDGIASEKRNGRITIFAVVVIVCILSGVIAFSAGFLQERFGE